MGYLFVIIALVILVPLIFIFANSRPGVTGRGQRKDKDEPSPVRTEPSADQPTPGAGRVNQGSSEASQRLPPS